jgi:hypothetical protein
MAETTWLARPYVKDALTLRGRLRHKVGTTTSQAMPKIYFAPLRENHARLSSSGTARCASER